MANVSEIEGVGPKTQEKLAAAGIETTTDLLNECGSADGRDHYADKTGLTARQLLELVNMADLMRLNGVGGEYAELMKAAGVDTVKELRRRNAENLAAKMSEVNEERNLTRRVPSAATVAKWVDEAGELPPKVSH